MPKKGGSAWLEDGEGFSDPTPYVIDAWRASYADNEARLIRALGRLWNDVVQADYGGRLWSEIAHAPVSASAPHAVQPEELALFVLMLGQVILSGAPFVTVPESPKPKAPRKRRAPKPRARNSSAKSA